MNLIDRTLGTLKPLTLYGVEIASRLLLGTARYPSPQAMSDAVKASRAGIVTVSVRREQARGQTGQRFFELIKELGVRVMPNTAGCRTPKEAIATAQMARELFATDGQPGDRQRRHCSPISSGWSRPPPRQGRLRGAAYHRGPGAAERLLARPPC
jgi:hypothetical protein